MVMSMTVFIIQARDIEYVAESLGAHDYNRVLAPIPDISNRNGCDRSQSFAGHPGQSLWMVAFENEQFSDQVANDERVISVAIDIANSKSSG